jgi:hypothetical protein
MTSELLGKFSGNTNLDILRDGVNKENLHFSRLKVQVESVKFRRSFL